MSTARQAAERILDEINFNGSPGSREYHCNRIESAIQDAVEDFQNYHKPTVWEFCRIVTRERDEAREAARRWNYIRQFATSLMNVIGLGWSTGPLTPERVFTPDELDAAIDRRMRSYPGETT